MNDDTAPQALVFDVFGTVVDWRGSIIEEGRVFGTRHGLQVDWAQFADDWRAGYQPAMHDVRSGTLPWTDLDGLKPPILDRLLAARGIALREADAASSTASGNRLRRGPTASPAYAAEAPPCHRDLVQRSTLRCMINMAKNAGLPWDTVLSAELFRHYKPDPRSPGAARLLGGRAGAADDVAAHPSDLRAAAACGLRTAYVDRPLERGPRGRVKPGRPASFDLVADIRTLAVSWAVESAHWAALPPRCLAGRASPPTGRSCPRRQRQRLLRCSARHAGTQSPRRPTGRAALASTRPLAAEPIQRNRSPA